MGEKVFRQYDEPVNFLGNLIFFSKMPFYLILLGNPFCSQIGIPIVSYFIASFT